MINSSGDRETGSEFFLEATSTSLGMYQRHVHANKIRGVPDLVAKEAVAALVVLVALSFISALFDAPIQGSAAPNGIPGVKLKAPWIFLGVQQMLKWLPTILAGVLIPVFGLLLSASLPILPGGRHAALTTFLLMLSAALLLTLWGYFA